MTDPAERLRRLANDEDCVGVDGIQRTKKLEMELNHAAAAAFGTPAGEQLLAWLKRITVNNVQGPAAPDSTLRHLEGQRFIVALIQQRIEHGRRNATPAAARKPSRVRGRSPAAEPA